MTRLWHDLQTHGLAAVLFLLYWLATLTVQRMTDYGGTPNAVVVLLLTTPLIAGALVGWWRRAMPEPAHRWRDRITGGMLVGVLTFAITMVVTKGGVIDEVISGIRRSPYFEGGEMLGMFTVGCVVGVLLGSVGAALAMILERVLHQGGGLDPHHHKV